MARTPIHPGEHLADAMEGLGINAHQLAQAIRVPPNRITAILNGSRAVTADTALRFGRYFGTSAEFWLNLQQLYDLRRAQREIGATLKGIRRGKRSPRISERTASRAA
jgi:antitoxin HigA-1